MDGLLPPVLRVELIFDAGRAYESAPLVADVTEDLLDEGTSRHSAAELELFFEQHGTQLRSPDQNDTSNLVLATIHRQADKVLPRMAEICADASISDSSIRREMRRRKQQLRENLADNDNLAFRLITEAIFGDQHPYGYNSSLEGYDALSYAAIRQHYREKFHAGNATLFVIGKLDARIEKLLDDTFGQLPGGPRALAPPLPPRPTDYGLFQVHRPRAQQTMIRMGRGGIVIQQPDYPGLVFLDTLFGGYFGSRLMRNIREEKGYTYGIDSDLDTNRFDGSFNVSADVANDNLAVVRQEIRQEMDKLKQDLVPTAEMDRVRAYLLGSIALELDGRYGHGFRHRAGLLKSYEPKAFLQRLDSTIREISAREVQDLAQQYLQPEQWFEVVIGGATPLANARLVTRPAALLRE